VYRDHTALGHAVRNGSTRVAELLRAAGATEPDLEPAEALLAAAMRGDGDAVRQALAAEPGLAAQAIARDPERIATAAELGRLDAIRLLVEIGRTAHHEAAYHGNREVVDALLALGADPDRRDRGYDATPSGWADHAGHADLAAFLASRETPPEG
jgi:ankyrin repeat protein